MVGWTALGPRLSPTPRLFLSFFVETIFFLWPGLDSDFFVLSSIFAFKVISCHPTTTCVWDETRRPEAKDMLRRSCILFPGEWTHGPRTHEDQSSSTASSNLQAISRGSFRRSPRRPSPNGGGTSRLLARGEEYRMGWIIGAQGLSGRLCHSYGVRFWFGSFRVVRFRFQSAFGRCKADASETF